MPCPCCAGHAPVRWRLWLSQGEPHCQEIHDNQFPEELHEFILSRSSGSAAPDDRRTRPILIAVLWGAARR